jgi:hypothetical protein
MTFAPGRGRKRIARRRDTSKDKKAYDSASGRAEHQSIQPH